MPGFLVEHLGSGDVCRHQIGRELDALEREVENPRNGFDQQRLGQAGYAGDQTMSAGKERNQHLIDDWILSDDDLVNLAEDAFTSVGNASSDSGEIF